jgi:hypothetical protein
MHSEHWYVLSFDFITMMLLDTLNRHERFLQAWTSGGSGSDFADPRSSAAIPTLMSEGG